MKLENMACELKHIYLQFQTLHRAPYLYHIMAQRKIVFDSTLL